jgi:hypothetical protein
MVLWDRETDNPGLVADVVRGARYALPRTRGGLPRREAARECWDFIRTCTRYVEETPDAQVIRMPWAFVREGVGDCKSQAIFVGVVCARSGCRVLLRFIIHPGETQPGHVYAVVDGVPSDPLCDFGKEFPYIRCLDVPLTN